MVPSDILPPFLEGTSVEKEQALPPTWQGWLQQNLARGCLPADMLPVMTAGGIAEHVARAALGLPVSEPHPALRDPYRYETSRLASGARINAAGHMVDVVARVALPVVAILDNVLSQSECDELIAMARSQMQRSKVVDEKSGALRDDPSRTSQGAVIPLGCSPLVEALDARIAALMGLPVSHGEPLQVLRYGEGGEYQPHFDYFPPDQPGAEAVLAIGGQRVSTLVVYLAAPEEGGTTDFPEIDLQVVPKQGRAVYFEYANSAGQVDRLSLHAGEPVVRGEKWMATRWMRERPYRSHP